MIDPFGRTITYLRVSVTDRCDFRCVYCMAEEMTSCQKGAADPRRTRPGVQRLYPARGKEAAPDRRRTAGTPQHHDTVRSLGRHLETGALDELT